MLIGHTHFLTLVLANKPYRTQSGAYRGVRAKVPTGLYCLLQFFYLFAVCSCQASQKNGGPQKRRDP